MEIKKSGLHWNETLTHIFTYEFFSYFLDNFNASVEM
jgi:hypothetical protein